jgi:uncharacterized protein YbjT (DUF2867 family)
MKRLMKAIIFGATGMVGQGVLGECLVDSGVTEVLCVGREPTGKRHDKLRELVHKDFTDFEPIAETLRGFDACFFCLGISVAGLDEETYRRITYTVALAAAKTIVQQNPKMTFIYVSGRSTDSTETTGPMWARVKGKTENDLLKLGFARAYMFRPGAIEPLDGIKSKTGWYRALYAVMGVLAPVVRVLAPDAITTTRALGHAMLEAVRTDGPSRVVECGEINSLAKASRTRVAN